MPPETHGRLWEAIHHYGYAAIFVLVFAENVGLPLPGETVFLVAIVMVAHGRLHWAAVGLCAWAAAVLGGVVGFAVGRYGGRQLLERYGSYVGIHERRLSSADKFFAKYGAAVVLVARFFYGLREVCAILAGCIAMPWRRFLAYNAVGAALWAGFWTALAVWFGPHLRRIWEAVKENEHLTLAGLIAALLIAGLSVYLCHRYRHVT